MLGDLGLTLPGGSCGTVGVAGLVTGGGFGLLSRKYGMFCDKLVRVRMVDGTGVPHEATRRNDPDGLLWATCGGGGGNFGVVTEFEFELVPITELVTTFHYGWPASDETARELVARFTRWKPSNEMFATALFRAGGGTGAFVSFGGQRFGSEADTRKELAAILDGGRPLPPPPTPSVSVQDDAVLDAAEAGGGDDAQHESFKMASSLGRGELSEAGIDALVARLHAGGAVGCAWYVAVRHVRRRDQRREEGRDGVRPPRHDVHGAVPVVLDGPRGSAGLGDLAARHVRRDRPAHRHERELSQLLRPQPDGLGNAVLR